MRALLFAACAGLLAGPAMAQPYDQPSYPSSQPYGDQQTYPTDRGTVDRDDQYPPDQYRGGQDDQTWQDSGDRRDGTYDDDRGRTYNDDLQRGAQDDQYGRGQDDRDQVDRGQYGGDQYGRDQYGGDPDRYSSDHEYRPSGSYHGSYEQSGTYGAGVHYSGRTGTSWRDDDGRYCVYRELTWTDRNGQPAYRWVPRCR